MSTSPSVSLATDLEKRPTTEEAAPRRGRWGRLAIRAAVGAALFTGAVGVLHLPFAAPLLRLVSPSSVCPVQKGSPAAIDRAHEVGAQMVRDSAAALAPARPALGFALDTMRKGDLDAWAAKYGVTCHSIAGNEPLQKCVAVPPEAVGQPATFGTLEEVCFVFKSTGELVNVQTLRRGLDPQRAATIVAELERGASSVLGPPTTSGGEANAAYLGRSFLSTYVTVRTFKDYRVTFTATNLAPTGVMVREEYLSAR